MIHIKWNYLLPLFCSCYPFVRRFGLFFFESLCFYCEGVQVCTNLQFIKIMLELTVPDCRWLTDDLIDNIIHQGTQTDLHCFSTIYKQHFTNCFDYISTFNSWIICFFEISSSHESFDCESDYICCAIYMFVVPHWRTNADVKELLKTWKSFLILNPVF